MKVISGFGCRILCVDPYPNDEARALGAEYVSLEEMLPQADIISLHCPLTPDTYHIIDDESIAQMKKGATLLNTGRGGLIDSKSAINGLKSGQIGLLGLDVYEEGSRSLF